MGVTMDDSAGDGLRKLAPLRDPWLLLGSVVAALLLRFSAPVLLLMGAPPPELDPEGMTAFAEQYLRWRAGAAPAALLMTVGAGVLRGVG